MKKIIILLTLLLSACFIVSCNSSNDSDSSFLNNFLDADKPKYVPKELPRILQGKESIELGEVTTPLNPQEVYAGLEYTPEMFYGYYVLPNEHSSLSTYKKDMDYEAFEDGSDIQISKIPHQIEFGPNENSRELHLDSSREWAVLFFYDSNDVAHSYYAAYTISGNTIKFNLVDEYKYDEENLSLNYKLSSTVLEYTFEFKGPYLTLSCDNKSVSLISRYFTTTLSINCQSSLQADSTPISNINKIMFSDSDTTYCYIEDIDGYCDQNAIAQMTEDGLFTFTWTNSDGVVETHQYVYFFAGFNTGIILADTDSVHYYTGSYFSEYKDKLNGLITYEDSKNIESLKEEELKQLVEKKENLLEDLAKAYKDAGLNVSINKATGEIALDSAVLFGVDEYAISSEGKEFLKKFINIYTSVVFGDTYEDFVSYIMVEGHTDTNGSYDMNLELSQKRANSVKDYCLCSETDISDEYKASLSSILKAAGYSFERPVYDENGNVDMDASRRVSFKFIININD